ncbi:MAG: MFS transporter [Alphaproteobacteria bacterium]
MNDGFDKSLPMRVQLPVYGVALFSNSIPDLVLVVMGLWLVELNTPLFMIGVLAGLRFVGPLLFAIHGGAMMDRIGTRRVLTFAALVMLIFPFVYPMAPWLAPIMALQLICGMADSLGWVGAQTLTGQVLRGNPTYTGRLVFATRIGTFAGPPIAGAAWDLFGPWGGFASLSLWGAGLLYSVLALPRDALSEPTERRQSIIKSVTPRLVDYIEAFKLFALPLMALVLAMTIIRQFGSGMQSAFYAVYLEGIGMPGTLIGILVSANGLTGIAALGTGALVKRIKEFSLLVWCIVASIVAIAIVPFFTDFIPLFIASSIRGAVMAISVVIIVSLIARTVGPTVQGRAMGLRTTCNQAANVTIPIVMGGLAHLLGLELAFYIVGAAGIALAMVTAYLARNIETPPV